MSSGEGYAHVPQVGHLLPLEPIEISLDCLGRVLEVLRRQMQCVLELEKQSRGSLSIT